MDRIRVSVGTATRLGLSPCKFKMKMETAYLLSYRDGRCSANCKFCAQAREGSSDLRRVARGIYPDYPKDETLRFLKEGAEDGTLKRACLQTINHPAVDHETMIKDLVDVGLPVTVSRHPATRKELEELKAVGVDRITIPLDAVTQDLFDEIKGKGVGNNYTWTGHWDGLALAVDVFGKGRVGTHIILGFGETEEDALRTMARLGDMGVGAGLFAFVPIKGTPLEDRPRPDIHAYRRVQLGYYILRKRLANIDDFAFEGDVLTDFGIPRAKLMEVVESGRPFMTLGCPNCNRPYSTESPGGEIYNYAFLPGEKEIEIIKGQLGLLK